MKTRLFACIIPAAIIMTSCGSQGADGNEQTAQTDISVTDSSAAVTTEAETMFDTSFDNTADTEIVHADEPDTADYRSVYSDYLLEEINSGEHSKDNAFDLYDVDLDGIPELFVTNGVGRGECVNILTVSNGEIKLLFEDIGMYGTVDISENNLISDTQGDGFDYAADIYEKRNNDYVKVINLRDRSAGVEWIGSDEEKYLIDDQAVTKEEFDEAYSKYNFLEWSPVGNKFPLDANTVYTVFDIVDWDISGALELSGKSEDIHGKMPEINKVYHLWDSPDNNIRIYGVMSDNPARSDDYSDTIDVPDPESGNAEFLIIEHGKKIRQFRYMWTGRFGLESTPEFTLCDENGMLFVKKYYSDGVMNRKADAAFFIVNDSGDYVLRKVNEKEVMDNVRYRTDIRFDPDTETMIFSAFGKDYAVDISGSIGEPEGLDINSISPDNIILYGDNAIDFNWDNGKLICEMPYFYIDGEFGSTPAVEMALPKIRVTVEHGESYSYFFVGDIDFVM